METWQDQGFEPGSGSTPVCYKNNTLQYSLDNGQVITIILDRLFPDTGFNIQVRTKITNSLVVHHSYFLAFGRLFCNHCLHHNWFFIFGFNIWFCKEYSIRNQFRVYNQRHHVYFYAVIFVIIKPSSTYKTCNSCNGFIT